MTTTNCLSLLPAALAFLVPVSIALSIAAPAAADEGGVSLSTEAKSDSSVEPKSGEEEEGKPTVVSGDFVLGFGAVPALNPRLPTSFATTQINGADQTKATSDSYIFAADHAFNPSVRLGVRLPLAHATLSPDRAVASATTRGRMALGDIELFARGNVRLSDTLRLRPRLGLTLPTAGGLPLPKNGEIAANPGTVYDQNTFDEYSVLQAAAGSRGFEENALFASRRLGIVPEVALEARLGKAELEPFVKLDNLFSVSKGLETAYEGGLAFGVSFAYPLTDNFGVGLRAFSAYEFESRVAGTNALAVIEPQFRAHFGPAALALGVLLPFLPDKGKNENPADVPNESASVTLNDPRFIAIRLAAAVGF